MASKTSNTFMGFNIQRIHIFMLLLGLLVTTIGATLNFYGDMRDMVKENQIRDDRLKKLEDDRNAISKDLAQMKTDTAMTKQAVDFANQSLMDIKDTLKEIRKN